MVIELRPEWDVNLRLHYGLGNIIMGLSKLKLR